MTTFLIVKNHISTAEQCRAFACGFPQKLWTKVAHQLQLKFPDHFPNDLYTLEQIHNAVWFVLHGTASLSLTLDDTRTPAPMMASIVKAKPTKLTTLSNMMKQAISKLGTPSAPALQAKCSSTSGQMLQHLRPNPRPWHRTTTVVISVGVSIGKVAAKYSRSTFVTESVYSADESHQILSYGLLFSTFYHFSYTAGPPTSATPM